MTNLIKIKKSSPQAGIALVLSVLILANLLMITFIVTDIILRIGRSSQQISDSEIAYFAAESGIEQGMYHIEKLKNASDLGTPGNIDITNPEDYSGSWKRYVEPKNHLPITCIDNDQNITYPDILPSAGETDLSCLYAASENENVINNSNPLIVRLAPGKLFVFDLDIAPPAQTFYPTSITITWPEADSAKIISLYHNVTEDTYKQDMIDIADYESFRLPDIGTFSLDPNYRLLISNESATENAYFTITPAYDNLVDYTLPVGLTLTSKGYYQQDEKERIIVVERRNWEIY